MKQPPVTQEDFLSILKMEMQLLQQRLVQFDELIWRLRSWCLALTIALMGWAVTTEAGLETSRDLLGLAVLVPVMFWLEEVVFRLNYYHKYVVRYRRLRAAFNEPSVDAATLPLYDLTNHIEGRGPIICGLRESILRPETMLFYLILAMVALAADYFM